jgi:hypothetical protein
MLTPALADGEVLMVTIGTDYADDIFSCAAGRRPSTPCQRAAVVDNQRILDVPCNRQVQANMHV